MSARDVRGDGGLTPGSGGGTRVDGTAVDKGLKPGTVALLSSIVIGMASTAPAYSLAATLGFVVIAVGVKAPAVMLLAFVPMYFVAVAYSELNKREPDCGTTFTWAARAFGPRTGWLGGWGLIAADVIVMANLAQIAGSYGYRLFGLDRLAESKLWTTVAGVLWIAVMTWVCYVGLEVSKRLQYVLLSVEATVLVAFMVFALVQVYSGAAPDGSLRPSLSWLWPSGLDWSSLNQAVLLAIFIYWGWDTAVAINEESDDPARTPGRAAIVSTLLLLATYAIVSIATVAFAGVGTEGIGLGSAANAADVFNAIGPAVFGSDVPGRVFEALLIISVLTSASASTQTTILPTARAGLSMGVYGAIPRVFSRIHPKYLSPSVSTVWTGGVSIAFYVGLTIVSDNVLQDSILAVGMLIAFYYGMTGFACVWQFRHDLRTPRDLAMRCVIPLLGGVLLLAIFVLSCVEYADPAYGSTVLLGVGGVFVVGIGTLLLGAALMFGYSAVAPAYFRGDTLRVRSSCLPPGREPYDPRG